MARTFCLLVLLASSVASLGAHVFGTSLFPQTLAPDHPIGTLVMVALVGRVLLALLPTGHPGEHLLGTRASGGLAATWAASHLLGLVYFTGLASVWEALGVQSTYSVETAIVLLLGAALVWTGPGDLVPRHDERQARPLAPLAWLVVLVAAAPLLSLLVGQTLPAIGSLRASNTYLDPTMALACFPAGLALIAFGANAGGIAPRVRHVALLGVALSPAVLLTLGQPTSAPLGPAFLAACAVAAGGIAWLRRADRRGQALSAIGSLALAWLLPIELTPLAPPFAVAGLLALVLATPPAGRRRIKRSLIITTFLAVAIALTRMTSALPAPTQAPTEVFAPLRQFLTSWSLPEWGGLFILADLVGLFTLIKRPWRGGPHPEPQRLFIWNLAVLAAALPILWLLLFNDIFGSGLEPAAVRAALVLMAPSAVLLIAINADTLWPAPRR